MKRIHELICIWKYRKSYFKICKK